MKGGAPEFDAGGRKAEVNVEKRLGFKWASVGIGDGLEGKSECLRTKS